MFWWYFPRIAVMFCGRILCANECLLWGLIIAWFHHENAGAQATNNFNNNCQKLQGLPLSGSALLWYNESISDMRQQKYKLKIEIKIPAALRRTYLIRSQVWITIAPYKNKQKNINICPDGAWRITPMEGYILTYMSPLMAFGKRFNINFRNL